IYSSFHILAATLFSTLSLHDALPILDLELLVGAIDVLARGVGQKILHLQFDHRGVAPGLVVLGLQYDHRLRTDHDHVADAQFLRSEEHTSELQSRENLVCRLLLEKKK